MKIDVQGFEYEVLLGARKTIEQHNPILLIETPGQQETEFLLRLEYESFVYKDSTLVPGRESVNVFFIPKSVRPELFR